MITTINEFKKHINENNSTYNYMITMNLGRYEHGAGVYDYERSDFIESAIQVLFGKISNEDMKQNNIKLYSNDVEIDGGVKLIDIDYDTLKQILKDNYKDHLNDLGDWDDIIISTYIDSNEL